MCRVGRCRWLNGTIPMIQRQACVAVCASLFSVIHVQSAVAHDSAEALRACMREPDDARRLACYDREMVRLLSPATSDESTAAAPTTTPELSAEERFGFSESEARKKQNVDEAPKLERLRATLTRIAQRPHGELVMTLDNGQVWVQKQAASFDVRVGDTVTIKAAALGSFLMSTASGRSTRVTRVL